MTRRGSSRKWLVVSTLIILWLSLTARTALALTLAESLEIGLKNNPSVRAAEAKAQAAGARVGQAWSFVLPSLSATASYGRNYSKTLLPTAYMPDEPTNVLNYSVNLQQNLFTFGKEFTGMDMADAGHKIAQNDLKQAQEDAICNIKSSYYNVLKAEKFLAVTSEGLKTLEKHYKQIKVFFDSGLALKTDLLQVEAQVGNLRVAEIQARSGLQLAKTAFNSVIGRPLSEEVLLEDAALPPASSATVTLDDRTSGGALDLTDLIKKSYTNRPDWRSFQLAKRIAGDSVWLVTAGYFPNLALSGSVGHVSTEFRSIHTTYELDNWRAMLVASWNIFDGLNTPFKVAEANANLAAIKAQEKQVADGVELEVTSAYLQLSAAKEKLAASRIAADVAARSLRLAQASYAAQISTSLAVLDAESAWNQAETNYWSSIYDLELAKAKINKVTATKVF